MLKTATPSPVPLVTVLMPAYNSEAYVGEAVASILAQTFTNFELLVIDDGSTDSTHAVLEAIRDPRLRLISNPGNLGLIATLNRGLELAAGRYVARMDADDLADPERLLRQVEFMELHPEVDVLGTMARLIDDTGKVIGRLADYPVKMGDVRQYLLRECCLIHPTVIFRKAAVHAVDSYDPNARHAEDYDLWLRLSDGHGIANLQDELLSYRMHRNQVSIRNVATQYRVAQRCRLAALERRAALGEDIDEVAPVVRPGVWRQLTAAECTLGREYLNWACLYRTMRSPRVAVGLAARALGNSPLSGRAWSTLLASLIDAVLPRSWRQASQWYAHRLNNALRAGRGES